MFNPTSSPTIGRTLSAVLLSFSLLGIGFLLGYKQGEQNPQKVVVSDVADIHSSSTPPSFGTFWEAWDLINENYIKTGEPSAEEKVYGAMRGLVRSLGDPHTEFFTPVDNKKFQEDIQGNFGGIGAELSNRSGSIVVVTPLKNTPAERAGIRAGDFILKVNASSTEGITLDETVSWIRGAKGTEVTLSIFRGGWDAARDITIVRDTIAVPTLEYSLRDDGIGYIQLYSFNASAEELFHKALVDLTGKGARGLVLDLRNNPGGYLEVAVDLASWFVPQGSLIVKEVSRIAEPEEFLARGNAALKDMPIVILVNEGSASASEILAGALRDLRRVKLVGKTTFGKGTVQQLLNLRDGSSIKLTIANWVLPSGKALEEKGLEPDIEVEITEADTEKGRDPQFDRAIVEMKALLSAQ